VIEEIQNVVPKDVEDLALVNDRTRARRAVLAVVDRPAVVAAAIAPAIPLAADEVSAVAAADQQPAQQIVVLRVRSAPLGALVDGRLCGGEERLTDDRWAVAVHDLAALRRLPVVRGAARA